MLRINLLPPYIFDKQKKIRLAIVWGIAAAAAIVAFVVWSSSVQARLNDKKKLLAEATDYKTKYDDLENRIKGVNDKVAVIRSKQTFIADSKKSNDSWPLVYEAMRDVTSDTILLQTLDISPQNHQSLNFSGFATDELTIARWWMSLRNATDRFDSVSLNLPTHPFVPQDANGAGRGMGFSGMRGGPMMGNRPSAMGIGMSGSSFGGGGMAGGPPMMGGMSSSPGAGMANMAQKFQRSSSGGGISAVGGGGGGFGGARNRGGGGETEVEGRRGLSFTGVAVLKAAYAPPIAPTWPASGGGAGGGMGMMGAMGMMGGPGMGGSGMMGGGARMPMMSAPPTSAGSSGGAPAVGAKGAKGGDD